MRRALLPTTDLMHQLVIESRQFKQTKRNEHQFVAFRTVIPKRLQRKISQMKQNLLTNDEEAQLIMNILTEPDDYEASLSQRLLELNQQHLLSEPDEDIS